MLFDDAAQEVLRGGGELIALPARAHAFTHRLGRHLPMPRLRMRPHVTQVPQRSSQK